MSLLRGHAERYVLAAVTVVFILLILLPLAVPAIALLGADGEQLSASLRLLQSAALWGLVLKSAVLAAAVTALALGVGVPLGALVGRGRVWGRWWALLLHALPIFLPPFILALGWFHLFGREGLAGGAASSALLFSPVGVILVLGVTFAPVATVLTVLGLRGVDPSLADAARVAASPARVTTRILLPLARPAIGLAAIIVFALALSEVGVAMFLRVDVYPTVVFTRLGGIDYNPGEAVVLALPLVAVTLLLVLGERWAAGGRSVSALRLGQRHSGGGNPRSSGVLPSFVAWAAGAMSLVPLAALAWAARDGYGQVGWWLGASLQESLVTAAVAATAIVAAGVIAGHALARGRPGGRVLDSLLVLGFVAPAALLGVGVIGLWNRPGTQWIYGSLGIVVLGVVGRYAIFGSRVVASAVAQSPRHLEEAAAAFGAGYLRRLGWIVVPVHARGVVAAWLLTVVFVLRDLETTILIRPPGRATLPVRIFTLEANGPPGIVAALAILHVVLTAAVVAIGAMALRPGRRA
ncbi:MAG: iron ABC transporter permease [Gemmatimonadales bacterium]|nr:iron ABC transporter permease [Gemmatimonadales bacterium]